MSKRKSIINGIISYIITFASLLLVIFVANNNNTSNVKMFSFMAIFLVGAIVFGFINALIHELGHVIFGKKNGFIILAFTVWFFKWTRKKNKYKFSFTMIGNEAGYTESVPKTKENLDKRLVNMTLGGLVFSFIMVLASVVPLFFAKEIPTLLFCFLIVSLPISIYYFTWNVLPILSEFAFNDGAVIWQVKHKTDTSKVMLSLLAVHSELYNGKTPAEIDESLYFDLPQLPEDDIYFINLLNARYNYYLDKEEYKKALEVSERLAGLMEYLPKEYEMAIKTDFLFNACYIEKNDEKAEDYLYEVEKYVNNVNTATNLRIKMAYLLFIGNEEIDVDMFYKKAIKEAKKSQIKGLELYETKLIDKVFNKKEIAK